MLQNVDYAIPRHKIGHKKVRECEALIQKLWGSSRQKLAVSIHESAHKLEFDSLGVVIPWKRIGSWLRSGKSGACLKHT